MRTITQETAAKKKNLTRAMKEHAKLEARGEKLWLTRRSTERKLARAKETVNPFRLDSAKRISSLEGQLGLLDRAIEEVSRRMFESKMLVQSEYRQLHPANLRHLESLGEFAEIASLPAPGT